MLLIPTACFGYAHWTDSVTKQIKLHYRCADAKVITYKLLSPWNDESIDRWPSDDELEVMHGTSSIIFSTNIFPEWYVWIGFIIQNQGALPAWVHGATFEVTDPNDIWAWFIHEEYYYGTWPRNDVPKGLYEYVFVQSASQKDKGKPLPKNAVDPPPDGYLDPDALPIYLEIYNEIAGPTSKDSMIMWIKLQLNPNYPHEDPFSIEISISITVTMAALEARAYQHVPDEPWSSVGEQQQGSSGEGTP